jgi:hypothetical protein
MKATRRDLIQGLSAVVATATLSMTQAIAPSAQAAAWAPPRRLSVRAVRAGIWEQLGPAQPIKRLFAPASGPLLASTRTGLLHSDGAGATWRDVPLPADASVQTVEVDPTDHRVIYVATPGGVHRSDDAGASWSLVLPSALATLRLAVSQAQCGVVYVAQGGGNTGTFAFLRSLDHGAAWEKLDEATQGPCAWSVLVLQPHPSDPARLFRTRGCYAGRNFGDALEQSRDNGSTFTTCFAPTMAFPLAIVGGAGAEPGRFYVAANNDFRSGGSLVVTSADDGATWTPIIEHKGGGTMTGAMDASTVITGLAYDPATPVRVFVGQERKFVSSQTIEASGVVATADGGQSWAPIGQQDLPHISQLLLGIDDLNLFAATETGVWRLALG